MFNFFSLATGQFFKKYQYLLNFDFIYYKMNKYCCTISRVYYFHLGHVFIYWSINNIEVGIGNAFLSFFN